MDQVSHALFRASLGAMTEHPSGAAPSLRTGERDTRSSCPPIRPSAERVAGLLRPTGPGQPRAHLGLPPGSGRPLVGGPGRWECSLLAWRRCALPAAWRTLKVASWSRVVQQSEGSWCRKLRDSWEKTGGCKFQLLFFISLKATPQCPKNSRLQLLTPQRAEVRLALGWWG